MVLPAPIKPQNQKFQTVHLISDTLGDVEMMQRQLEKAGVAVSPIATPFGDRIAGYDVEVPETVHVLIMGDFLSYAKKNMEGDPNVPPYIKASISNRKMMKLIAALAENENVTVLVGTSEVHALGMIDRHDHEVFSPDIKVITSLSDLVFRGKVVHSAVVSNAEGIEFGEEVRLRHKNLQEPSDYIATHAGITFGIWKYLSSSVMGSPYSQEPARYIQDPMLISLLLNHDLILATRAVYEKSTQPDFGIDLVERELWLPETVTASKYVHRGDVDKLSSPTSADPRELHDSWHASGFHFPRFGMLRAHSSIVPDKFEDSRLPIDTFVVGGQETKGITIGNSPCITIHPDDAPEGTEATFSMGGVVNAPIHRVILASSKEISMRGSAAAVVDDIDPRTISSSRGRSLFRDFLVK